MDQDEKNRIRENLVYLTDNTKNIRRFAIHLVAEGLLSKSDKQIMENKSDDMEKLYHLYTEVMKTGKYAELIEILDATENTDVADKLRTLPSYQKKVSSVSQTPGAQPSGPGVNDFVVSRDGISEIVSILGEYPSMNEVWPLVASKLLRQTTLNNLKTDGIHSVIVMNTLDAWRNDKHADATLQSLVKIIEPHNHAAAMALLDQAEKIRKA